MEESQAPLAPGAPIPSGAFGIYRADGSDLWPCCFCTRMIRPPDAYHRFDVAGQPRRAHHPCLVEATKKVIAARDARGVSEDLQQLQATG